jgi:hypothetical protein
VAQLGALRDVVAGFADDSAGTTKKDDSTK